MRCKTISAAESFSSTIGFSTTVSLTISGIVSSEILESISFVSSMIGSVISLLTPSSMIVCFTSLASSNKFLFSTLSLLFSFSVFGFSLSILIC